MPTGYTSKVQRSDDYTFDEFVWSCARAMGALLSMRDDPVDYPIKDNVGFENYEAERLKEVEKELAEIKQLSDDDWEQRFKKSCKKDMEYYLKSLKEMENYKRRYSSMLKRVEVWEPPTKDHDGLKEFMASQLKSSIDWDVHEVKKPEVPSLEDFKKTTLEGAVSSVEYYGKKSKETEEREGERNEWVDQLKESVPMPHYLKPPIISDLEK